MGLAGLADDGGWRLARAGPACALLRAARSSLRRRSLACVLRLKRWALLPTCIPAVPAPSAADRCRALGWRQAWARLWQAWAQEWRHGPPEERPGGRLPAPWA